MVIFKDAESVLFTVECMDGVKMFGKTLQIKPKNGSEQERRWKRMLADNQERLIRQNSFGGMALSPSTNYQTPPPSGSSYGGRSISSSSSSVASPTALSLASSLASLSGDPHMLMQLQGQGQFLPPGLAHHGSDPLPHWRFGTARGSAHTPTYAGGESPAEHRDRDRSREDRGSTGGYGGGWGLASTPRAPPTHTHRGQAAHRDASGYRGQREHYGGCGLQ
ncbi:unnamed protein product [Anisakis simplex]|uniref:Uncharacterized protein n=1 Tax=Anisakis simplex TaxID=6269 RepID=A0A3P6U9Z7_ANISI|nr:unnamed protein product [Anisakis simplex]